MRHWHGHWFEFDWVNMMVEEKLFINRKPECDIPRKKKDRYWDFFTLCSLTHCCKPSGIQRRAKYPLCIISMTGLRHWFTMSELIFENVDTICHGNLIPDKRMVIRVYLKLTIPLRPLVNVASSVGRDCGIFGFGSTRLRNRYSLAKKYKQIIKTKYPNICISVVSFTLWNWSIMVDTEKCI